jgi:hypothetical protein
MVACVKTVSLDSKMLEEINIRGWSLSALLKEGFEMKKAQKTLADFETKKQVELEKKIERLSELLSQANHRIWALEEKKNV